MSRSQCATGPVRPESRHKPNPKSFEGRGGQQLLLKRLPFCPARDCHRLCDPESCTCRPCACVTCRARRAAPMSAIAAPVFSSPFVHPRLFAVQPQEVRLVRPHIPRKYRQGDVLVVESTKSPKELTPVPLEGGRLILAHGEVTGHAHVVVGGTAELFTPSDAADLEERFLRIEGEDAELVHDEHGTIALPPGDYRVLRQREYTPEAIRTVAD